MDFVGNQKEQIDEMLDFLGIKSIEELWKAVPQELWQSQASIDDGLSEFEGLRLMETIAEKNQFVHFDSYLGAGAYEHHIPAIVSAICSKSEFLTSYTQYQAEVSQGMLQAIFEYQSAVCALTGMDASNASLYDGASAVAEAALMAFRINKNRNAILLSDTLHPHYIAAARQYLASHGFVIKLVNSKNLPLNDDVAAIVFQYPNFYGTIEDLTPLFSQAKEVGALSIVCANPLAYGLYKSAGELGADIAVGDMQPFGLPLSFGGPYCGYIACKNEYIRQLPGRIVGKTKDLDGKEGFVLTLQAREQHIRREKATSNICSNQALAAIASLITLLWYGKNGIKALALDNFQRASYLRSSLSKFCIVSEGPILNEFTVTFKNPVEDIFEKEKIIPGLPLEGNTFLVCVTETKSKAQLDKYIEIARRLK